MKLHLDSETKQHPDAHPGAPATPEWESFLMGIGYSAVDLDRLVEASASFRMAPTEPSDFFCRHVLELLDVRGSTLAVLTFTQLTMTPEAREKSQSDCDQLIRAAHEGCSSVRRRSKVRSTK